MGIPSINLSNSSRRKKYNGKVIIFENTEQKISQNGRKTLSPQNEKVDHLSQAEQTVNRFPVHRNRHQKTSYNKIFNYRKTIIILEFKLAYKKSK